MQGRESGWARQSGQKIHLEMLHSNAMDSSVRAVCLTRHKLTGISICHL
jgi:hypothetical protein